MNKQLAFLWILFVAWHPIGAHAQPNSPTQKVIFENEFVRVLELRVPPGIAEAKRPTPAA